MNPLVTVVIPHFNRTEFLRETLSSLRLQSYSHWEALVVDDGSTPEVVDELISMVTVDSRIQLIERDRSPKGANVCRNIGIERSKGDFLVFLDSDDLLAPYALEQRVNSARECQDYDYLVFQVEKFELVPGDTGVVWNNVTKEDNLARFLRQDSVWQTAGPLWRKEALQKLNGFDERLACWQDLDIHVRALAVELTYKTRFDLPADCHYRLHDSGSISQQPFVGRNKMYSLATFFLTCTEQTSCLGSVERRKALSSLAKHVVFKQLEQKQFDLYISVLHKIKQLDLLPSKINMRLRFLHAFFRVGGYKIKGTYRLRKYFLSLLEN